MSKFSLKKITALVMVLVLVLGATVVGSFAGQTVAPLFTISDVSTNQGEKFDVTIKFAQDVSPSSVNISALDVSLVYNSDIYTVVNTTKGAGLESAFSKLSSGSDLHLETGNYIFGSSIKEAGTVKWSMSTVDGFTFQKGTDFAVVTFKAKDVSSIEGDRDMTVKVTNAANKNCEDTTALYSDAKNDVKIEVNLSKLCDWELNEDATSYILAKFNDENATRFEIPDTYKDGSKAALPITKVKAGAFTGCKKMQEITFGKNIETIASGTFFNCETLKKATFYSDNVKIGESAFLNSTTNLVFRCRKGSTAEAFALKNKISVEYFGEATTFTITDVEDAKYYTGSPVTLSNLKVVDSDGNKLTEGTDYTLAYENNIMPGEATVNVTGIGSYTGTQSFKFTIYCPYHSTSHAMGFYTEKNVYEDCAKGGYVEKSCAFCGYYDKSTTLSVKNHTPDKEIVIEEATCQHTGKKVFTCKDCKATYSDVTTEIVPHKYGWVITKEPVWDTLAQKGTAGERKWQCIYCGAEDPTLPGQSGYVETKTMPVSSSLTDHYESADWKVTKEPTCSTFGQQIKYCTECGVVLKTEEIAKTAHVKSNVGTVVKAPTCTADGTISYKCENCGEICEQKIFATAFGHNWSSLKVIVEATCETAGRQGCVCSICGAEKDVSTINTTGHEYTSEYVVIKEATCTESGISGIKCKKCGEAKPGFSYTVSATGHTYGAWSTVVEPTCMEQGLKQRTCSKCSEAEVSLIDKTGHKESNEVITRPTYKFTGTAKVVCEYCKYDFNKTVVLDKIVPDVNADKNVNSADALMILQHATELITLSDTSLWNADCNGDAKVNSTDALLVLQLAVGLIKAD